MKVVVLGTVQRMKKDGTGSYFRCDFIEKNRFGYNINNKVVNEVLASGVYDFQFNSNGYIVNYTLLDSSDFAEMLDTIFND